MSVGKLPVLSAALGMARDSAAASSKMAPHLRQGANNMLVLKGARADRIARSAQEVSHHGTEAVRHARDAAVMLRRVDDPQFVALADQIDSHAGSMAEIVVKARTGTRKIGYGKDGYRHSSVDAMAWRVGNLQQMVKEETEAQEVAARLGPKGSIDLQRMERLVLEADDARVAADRAARFKVRGESKYRLIGVRSSKIEASRTMYRDNAARASEAAREAAALLDVSNVLKHEEHARILKTAADELTAAAERVRTGKVVAHNTSYRGTPGKGIAPIARELRQMQMVRELEGRSGPQRVLHEMETARVLSEVDELDAL